MITFNVVWLLLEIKNLRKGRSLLCEDMLLTHGSKLRNYVTVAVAILTFPTYIIASSIQYKHFHNQTRYSWDSFKKRNGIVE